MLSCSTPRAAVPPPPPADPAATAPDAAVPEWAARLAHLFRLSQRQGRIHPLQAAVARYRAGERP
jgi:hypothetical protein